MKKEIANRWIEALLSGKYKQGKKQLISYNNEFCCLGVLCDISGLDEWKGKCYDGSFTSLPEVVQKWAEMKSDCGIFSGIEFSLTELNDHGYSFEEIANFIKKHWEEL